MKLSIFNILSKTVSLSFAVSMLAIAMPAMAEQIDRSRSAIDESLPSVTDLNLVVPSERKQQYIDSDSPEFDPDTIATSKNPSKARSTVKRRDVVATNAAEAAPVIEQSTKVKSTIRRRDTVATNGTEAGRTIEQPSKVRSTIRRRDIVATNATEATPVTEQSTKVRTIGHKQSVSSNITESVSTNSRENSRPKSSSRKIAAVSRPPLSGGNYLVLVKDPSKGTNDLGNPIYTLEAYANGEMQRSVNAVSGTGTTQNRNRNLSNTFAPLPDGTYHVSDQIVSGSVPEVGRTFIAITPRFETERSDLGIHLDPSFNKRNGSDGTAGCIGITNQADRDAINQFVIKYHPRNLIVKIASN
jgi:hypothetical protein